MYVIRGSAWIIALLALVVSVLPASAEEEGAEEDARGFTRVPAPDGIQIRRTNETDGAKPSKTDRVVVHYHGTLSNGKVFDSSVERGSPATFPLDRVVPCWTEAVTRMHVGEKAEVICPPDTAYGARGAPPLIPPNATLTFEIELLGIQ